MPAFEKKLTDWLKKHLDLLFVLAVAALGLALRYPLHSLHAAVPGGQGSVAAIFADLLPAAAGAWLLHSIGEKQWKCTLAFALLFLSPAAIFSSAVYGSFEAVTVGLCIGSFLLLREKKHVPAFVLYALACMSGFYAWLFLPAFLFCYLYEERFSLLLFALPGAGSLLRVLAENAGFRLRGGYLPEGLAGGKLYVDCASFWAFLKGNEELLFRRYLPLAWVLPAALVAAWIFLFCRKNRKYDEEDLLLAVFPLVQLAAYFLPGADSLSAICISVPAWILALIRPQLIPVALLLDLSGVIPMAGAIYGAEWMPVSLQAQSWIRAAALAAEVCLCLKRKKKA
ncbi:MAG: hypothetical protein K6E50_11750 [Lachnospiraceae bacterium]|nr:hypothetical protein [Lachnospiraceae bacterium]